MSKGDLHQYGFPSFSLPPSLPPFLNHQPLNYVGVFRSSSSSPNPVISFWPPLRRSVHFPSRSCFPTPCVLLQSAELSSHLPCENSRLFAALFIIFWNLTFSFQASSVLFNVFLTVDARHPFFPAIGLSTCAEVSPNLIVAAGDQAQAGKPSSRTPFRENFSSSSPLARLFRFLIPRSSSSPACSHPCLKTDPASLRYPQWAPILLSTRRLLCAYLVCSTTWPWLVGTAHVTWANTILTPKNWQTYTRPA